MNAKLFCAAVALAAVTAACGGDDKGSTTSSSSGGSSSGTSGTPASSGGTEDAGASSGSTSPTPKTIAAPKLTELMKMTGSLHVVWDLPAGDTECEKIEGERKSETEPYKVAWTVPGTVDNKHDGTATDDTMYTYRLRCKIGSEYSDYSAEMSKNPLK